MSRYSSKRELVSVIKLTIANAGIAARDVYMSRVLSELGVMGDSYYGWTYKNMHLNPVDVANRHIRKRA